MARIKLETTQNVLLEFDLAGAGERISSGLLDLLFKVVYGMICFILLYRFFHLSNFEDIPTWLLSLIIILITPIGFYDLLFELFMNGQSPGKKIMKLKVIKLDGSQPGIGDYLLRWFFRAVDYLPFCFITGIIAIAVSKKEQRLGDIVANTTVIKLKKRATLEDTILRVLEHNYKPIFSDVLRFSDKDINTIKEALEIYKRTKNPKHIDLLAMKAKQLLNAETTNMSSTHVLETLIKDYNYYTNES
ncbi:MAG TPA: RDD family protein [Cytophagaceae bacterium]|jgi:uncharacterized RDD family membrane protein YckC|nr:RDD family protein [Cytophagaceae bacterium]